LSARRCTEHSTLQVAPTQLEIIRRSAICSILAVLVFSMVARAFPVCFMWLVLACLYMVYQWQFALVGPLRRPLADDTISSVLFIAHLGAHPAVAIFCGVGWVGILLVFVSYFSFGGLAGHMAKRRGLQDCYRALDNAEPRMSLHDTNKIANAMLEQRIRERYFNY